MAAILLLRKQIVKVICNTLCHIFVILVFKLHYSLYIYRWAWCFDSLAAKALVHVRVKQTHSTCLFWLLTIL